jgi:hypothetical protein
MVDGWARERWGCERRGEFAQAGPGAARWASISPNLPVLSSVPCLEKQTASTDLLQIIGQQAATDGIGGEDVRFAISMRPSRLPTLLIPHAASRADGLDLRSAFSCQAPRWLDFWEIACRLPSGRKQCLIGSGVLCVPSTTHSLPLQGGDIGYVSDCARHGVGSLRLHHRERSNHVVFRKSRKGKSDLGPRSAREVLGS